MGYSIRDCMVRLDVFKPSGKWSDCHQLNMEGYYEERVMHTAIANSVIRAQIEIPLDWYIVVLEPYHKHSHPIMLTGEGVMKYATGI